MQSIISRSTPGGKQDSVNVLQEFLLFSDFQRKKTEKIRDFGCKNLKGLL